MNLLMEDLRTFKEIPVKACKEVKFSIVNITYRSKIVYMKFKYSPSDIDLRLESDWY